METKNKKVCRSNKKRKHITPNNDPKLLVGDKVEVRGVGKGRVGSWHTGTVIACEYRTRMVQYDHQLCVDGSEKLNRSIKVPPILDGIVAATKSHRSHQGCIRPLPHSLDFAESTLRYGQCVDAYHDEAWWEGVIFDSDDCSENRLIFFPDTGHQMYFMSNNVRITQDWDEFQGYWKARRNWFFLELIEDIKQQWPLQVSVEQIWSEVKEKDDFRKQLRRWTSTAYTIWKNLVWETFSGNFELVLKHFLKEPNLFGDGDDTSPLLFSEGSFHDILKPNSNLLISPPKKLGRNPRSCYNKKNVWLPASRDIVSGPKFSPESVKKWIDVYNSNKRPSDKLRLHVRRHLLSLGWKIEFKRVEGKLFFLYTSPSGKSCHSLLEICKNLNDQYSDPNLVKTEEYSDNGSEFSPRKLYLVPEAEFHPDPITEYNLQKDMWLPAGNDIVSGPEFSPDSVRKCIDVYTSPSGKSCQSLPEICKNLNDRYSDPNSVSNTEEFFDNGSEFSTRKAYLVPEAEFRPDPITEYNLQKDMWLPAGNDIVSGPEFSPDSVRKCIDVYNRKKKPSAQLILQVRKHLLFLEWKIEFKKVKGRPYFLYTSPSGKPYTSLLKIFKNLNDQHSDLKLESKLEELYGNDLEFLRRKVYLVPEAEFRPDAIREFNLHSKTRKNRNISLVLNVRKHLSYLGWKIELLRCKGVSKMQYTSPDGKSYESLPKALQGLSEATHSLSIIPYKNGENILATKSEIPHTSPLSIIPYENGENILPAKSEKPVTSLLDEPRAIMGNAAISPHVEPEYYPEAIEQYCFLSSVKGVSYSKTFADPKNLEVKMKAKKHLAALGWSFWYTMRRHGKRVKRELRYTSPSGKIYHTLQKACISCIDGVLYESNTIIPVVDGSMNVDENEETLTQFLKSSKSVEAEVKAIPKVKSGRKRMNSVKKLHSHSLHKKEKKFKSKHLKNINKKESLVSMESNVGDRPKKALRSCQTSQKGMETTLSRLIDSEMLSLGEKVHYVSKHDNCRIGEGVITQDGIECKCCQKVFTINNFELHVSNGTHRAEGTIILEDGLSLSDCEFLIKCPDDEADLLMEPHVMKDTWDPKISDYICSICRDGGDLILCDQCPSSFHTKCLALQCVPDGEWFCPSCLCGICGDRKFSNATNESGDEIFASCYQCENKYHVGCLRLRAVLKFEKSHNEKWFCNERCEQIFLGLQKILGKPVPVAEENITWTLLKDTERSDCDHSKLNLALSVMHECFEPLKEQETKRDIYEDVIFSRWSELNRLNFRGFYTVLLEKNEEVFSVAIMRVHGERVAEVPLIGTRFQYRRLGKCHILMNELEKKLKELGVERLVLPAVPSMLDTWTGSFGFTKMTALERLNFLDYTFLDFEGTTMCQKLLNETPSPCLDHLEPQQTMAILTEDNDLDVNNVVSEVYQADSAFPIDEADPVLPNHDENLVVFIEKAFKRLKLQTRYPRSEAKGCSNSREVAQ